MSRMNNLTLASAKHLLSQGHITPAHHQKIVAAATAPALPAMAQAAKMPKMKKAPGFGALAKAPAFAPQQAQGPVPGVGAGPPVMPPGMMAGPPDED